MNRHLLSLALLTVIGLSCGKDTPPTGVTPPGPPPPPAPPPPPPPPGATPGPLTVTLATPNNDDGALLLEVKGPSVRTVTASSSAIQVFSDTTSTTAVRVVVAGNLTAGKLFTFQVPDTRQASAYAVTIVDIADRQNKIRNGNSGYSLAVAP